MEATKGRIGLLQIFMIFMLMNGLSTHVIINPMLLEAAGRDAWLSVLMTGVLYLPWCIMIALMIRRSEHRKLQPWLAERTSPFVSWLLLAPIYIILFLIGMETVEHTTIFVVANYLPQTPQWVIVVVLILICVYCASAGIRTIATTAGILLPIVIILGYFVAFANMPEKDYSLLRPVLENGWLPPIRGTIYVGSGLVELIFIIGLQHRMKQSIKIWQVLLFGIFMLYIMLGPIIGGITEFGAAEAAKQQESPYEQWRLVKIGAVIEHVDFLSEFQWLSGALIRISLSLYLIVDVFSFRQKQSRLLLMSAIALTLMIPLFIPFNRYSLYKWIMHGYVPITLAVLFGISIILACIAFIPKRANGGIT